MAYIFVEPQIGLPGITSVSNAAAPLWPIGSIERAFDSTLGGGEFIYLYGAASTVVGSVVTYNPSTGLTTLVPNTANLDAPLAVAMSANVGTTTAAWYQIEGAAVIKKTAVAVNPVAAGIGVKLYLSGAIGRLMPTAASGKNVMNCMAINAATVSSATSTITAQINRPFAQGAVA